METSLQSICILRLSAIGDVCNAVAAVQAIQKKHPDAKVTWVIGKIEKVLLEGLPGVEFIIFDKSQGRAAFKQLKQDMQGKKFDVLLHMQVALRANWAARLIPAKRKIGFDRKRAKELHSLFTNERVKPQHHAHVLEGFFAFAEKLGVDENAIHDLHWNIPIPISDQDFANQHIPEGQKTLVISPAASKPERNWLAENYAAIADYAHDKGFKVVLCGGPADIDKSLGQAIESHTKCPVLNLIAQTNLKQMLALLGNASIVLAPDTGPAHMAVSQKTPVLGLYAHSNPKRTGPYLYLHYVAEVYYHHLLKQLDKSSRQVPWGTRVKGAKLMQDIEVNMVIKQFDKLQTELKI